MISDIIAKAENGSEVSVDEVFELMSITDASEMEELFSAARRVRDRNFGKKIFTYGFVYFSTYCKNNCSFCYYRCSNNNIGRYRKSVEEIVQLAGSLKDAGINLADLTMGEDPKMYADGYKGLLDIISSVRDEVGIILIFCCVPTVRCTPVSPPIRNAVCTSTARRSAPNTPVRIRVNGCWLFGKVPTERRHPAWNTVSSDFRAVRKKD